MTDTITTEQFLTNRDLYVELWKPFFIKKEKVIALTHKIVRKASYNPADHKGWFLDDTRCMKLIFKLANKFPAFKKETLRTYEHYVR
jgi:hypothetical protein